MTETLTESFCERCGTRYEFTAPTRLNPLRKTKGFIGGLKNWVTSQDDMSDAMRDAMRQQEEALAGAQLEAFHESFNFCIDCRQYTCVNCWNDDAGRCRSCAPIPGTDDLAERLTAAMAGTGPAAAVAEPILAEDELQRRLGMATWPTSDLPLEAANGHRADVEWPDADVSTIAGGPEPASEPEPEPILAEAEPEPEPIVAEIEPEPEPVAEPLLRVVAWEDDATYDATTEAVVAEVEPEPIVAAAEPEVEPEPIVAEAKPEARPRIAPISETILHFPERTTPARQPERQAAETETPEVAARRAQLDLLGLGDVGDGPVEPARPSVVPYRSRGAAPTAAELAARAGGGFWEASAREVAGAATAIGVQNCGQCGLSLSANARFCRRCGTRQARSA